MLIVEIQDNVNKAKDSLQAFETNFIYKGYKTLGGAGKFEQELRSIYNQLINLKNSVISHTESIIRLSENKDLLSLIDQNFYQNFTEAISDESNIRMLKLPDFNMPTTSLNVISENKNVITEMQAITKEVSAYNNMITAFRQQRTKYYITLYKVPNNNELPDIIDGSVNLEGLLPNEEVLSSYVRNKNIVSGKKNITIQPIKEIGKVKVVKKGTGMETNKIKIVKKK
jgi:hypothetical protein